MRLNGSTEFTDYGRYETVSNLSTTGQPQLTDEGVTWTLSDPDSGRFYFEVQPKDDFLGLPWDIDVSYMLDGVPLQGRGSGGEVGTGGDRCHCDP